MSKPEKGSPSESVLTDTVDIYYNKITKEYITEHEKLNMS